MKLEPSLTCCGVPAILVTLYFSQLETRGLSASQTDVSNWVSMAAYCPATVA